MTDTEFDINKAAAYLAQTQLSSIYDSFKNSLSSGANGNRIKSALERYLHLAYRNHRSTKTLIYHDTPTPIEQFYEPIELESSDLAISVPRFKSLDALTHPLLVTGTGGCGKSTLIKYLFLDCLQQQTHFPVLIELRFLESEGLTIKEFVEKKFFSIDSRLEPKDIGNLFFKCNLAVFLDGLDELSIEKQIKVTSEIERFVESNPASFIVITSRPGEDFRAWKKFIELKAQPLTRKKAINLVQRLAIDEALKSNFIAELKGDLFEKHRSFFQNPLLLSIMLITYEDSAAIPAQLHNFYALAFDSLFYRHDALKVGFRRPTLTQMPIDKGKAIMSSFSIITYLDQSTSFNYAQIKNYLDKAQKIAGTQYDETDLLKDLVSAFCMFTKDGAVYAFSHRSFQEYFAAYYFTQAQPEEQKKIVEKFSSRLWQDSTLRLSFDMNQSLFERLCIIPFLEYLSSLLTFRHGQVTKAALFRVVDAFYEQAVVDRPADDDEERDRLVMQTTLNEKNSARIKRQHIWRFILYNYSKPDWKEIYNESELPVEDIPSELAFFLGEGRDCRDLKRSPQVAQQFYECSWLPLRLKEAMSIKKDIEQKLADNSSSILKMIS